MSESGKNAYRELAQTIKDKTKIRNIRQPTNKSRYDENFDKIGGGSCRLCGAAKITKDINSDTKENVMPPGRKQNDRGEQ